MGGAGVRGVPSNVVSGHSPPTILILISVVSHFFVLEVVPPQRRVYSLQYSFFSEVYS